MKTRVGQIVRVGQRQAAAGGVIVPAAGSRVIRMVIKSLNFVGGPLFDDHVICYRHGDATRKNIIVAKPWDLQKTPWHGVTRDGITYTYTNAITRRAQLANGENQTETIKPPYAVGRELQVAYPVEGGTGVSGGETVGSQRLSNTSFDDFLGGWLFDPNSNWSISASAARHAAGGAGRVYTDGELLVPGTLYEVKITFAGGITGTPPLVYCGTESKTFTSSIPQNIRCQGNGIFAIYGAADTVTNIDTATATVVEPAQTPYQDINAGGRQWYRVSED